MGASIGAEDLGGEVNFAVAALARLTADVSQCQPAGKLVGVLPECYQRVHESAAQSREVVRYEDNRSRK